MSLSSSQPTRFFVLFSPPVLWVREWLRGCLAASRPAKVNPPQFPMQYLNTCTFVCMHMYRWSVMTSVSTEMFRTSLLFALHCENEPVVSTCCLLTIFSVINHWEDLLFWRTHHNSISHDSWELKFCERHCHKLFWTSKYTVSNLIHTRYREFQRIFNLWGMTGIHYGHVYFTSLLEQTSMHLSI